MVVVHVEFAVMSWRASSIYPQASIAMPAAAVSHQQPAVDAGLAELVFDDGDA
jgi:hypothetical protein